MNPLIPGRLFPNLFGKPVGQMFDISPGDEEINNAVGLVETVHRFSHEIEEKLWVRRGVTKNDLDPEGEYTGNTELGRAIGITIKSDTADPVFAFLHEVGHYIDHRLLLPLGEFASTREHILDAMRDWRRAVENTQRYKVLKAEERRLIEAQEGPKDRRLLAVVQYRLQIRELFARSYAQYIIVRCPDEWAQNLVTGRLADPEKQDFVWELEDFVPVAEAIDELFLRRAWLQAEQP